MSKVVLVAGVCMLVPVLAGAEETTQTLSLPEVYRRAILAISVDDGRVTVVTQENPERGQPPTIRLFGGRHGEASAHLWRRELADAGARNVRAFALPGCIAIGWADPRGLTVLRWVPGGGEPAQWISTSSPSIRDWWLVQIGEQPTLLVADYRVEGEALPEGQPRPAGGIGETWLTSYVIGEGGSLEVGAAACVEIPGQGEVLPATLFSLECAAFPSGAVLWAYRCSQTFEHVLSVARWDDDPFHWDDVYIGGTALAVSVDPVDGSRVLVAEAKHPRQSAGIVCGVPMPMISDVPAALGSYGPDLYGPIQLSAIRGTDYWLVVHKAERSVVVTRLYRDLEDPVGSRATECPGLVQDCRAVSDGENVWIAVVTADTLSLEMMPLPSLLSAPRP